MSQADLDREVAMSTSRILREDYLDDDALLAHVRCRVEKERTFATAYGEEFSTQDFVTSTLGHLADVVKERARGLLPPA